MHDAQILLDHFKAASRLLKRASGCTLVCNIKSPSVLKLNSITCIHLLLSNYAGLPQKAILHVTYYMYLAQTNDYCMTNLLISPPCDLTKFEFLWTLRNCISSWLFLQNSNQTVNNRHITHVHIIMLITIVCRQWDVNSNISLGTGIATNQKPFITMGRNWWEGETRTLL